MTAGDAAYDVVVVGAGLVGLASARAFLHRSPRLRVAVVEKEVDVATHQSGRNSGVVHAGLYYAAGSLKARLCREGREELLRFADERGIPFRLYGKLVIATGPSELGRLEELRRRGVANGLRGLRMVERDEIAVIEPHAVGVRALHVPETGSIDYRHVARALADEVRELGGEVLLGRPVTAIRPTAAGQTIETSRGELRTRVTVSCAGVQADRVARLTGSADEDVRIVPFRGDYHVLSPRAAGLVRGHIYPVPDPTFPFLGVHFSRRMDGQVWAGPNAVPALARERYGRLSVAPRDAVASLGFPGVWRLARAYYRTGVAEIWRDHVTRAAVREMRRYVPALRPHDVRRGPAGIRAQLLARDGRLVDDFLVSGGDGVLHVLNAPSPAATACLAIGRLVAERVLDGSR